jgi:hypothetical protein
MEGCGKEKSFFCGIEEEIADGNMLKRREVFIETIFICYIEVIY